LAKVVERRVRISTNASQKHRDVICCGADTCPRKPFSYAGTTESAVDEADVGLSEGMILGRVRRQPRRYCMQPEAERVSLGMQHVILGVPDRR